MTTYIGFAPSPTTPFQFQPTLDGQPYTAIVTWSLYGQRWYLNIYTLQGQLVLSTAMVGSPPGYDINLVVGAFTTSTLVFRQASQQFEINP